PRPAPMRAPAIRSVSLWIVAPALSRATRKQVSIAVWMPDQSRLVYRMYAAIEASVTLSANWTASVRFGGAAFAASAPGFGLLAPEGESRNSSRHEPMSLTHVRSGRTTASTHAGRSARPANWRSHFVKPNCKQGTEQCSGFHGDI